MNTNIKLNINPNLNSNMKKYRNNNNIFDRLHDIYI